MSNRDTQFQGFAKALWDELVRANGYGYIDVNKWDDDGIDPTNYIQVIARRAYDLAIEVAKQAIDGNSYDEERDARRIVAKMGDMTELLEEQGP